MLMQKPLRAWSDVEADRRRKGEGILPTRAFKPGAGAGERTSLEGAWQQAGCTQGRNTLELIV